jgi:hypothetical protein
MLSRNADQYGGEIAGMLACRVAIFAGACQDVNLVYLRRAMSLSTFEQEGHIRLLNFKRNA